MPDVVTATEPGSQNHFPELFSFPQPCKSDAMSVMHATLKLLAQNIFSHIPASVR
jgi:hypothetical protein